MSGKRYEIHSSPEDGPQLVELLKLLRCKVIKEFVSEELHDTYIIIVEEIVRGFIEEYFKLSKSYLKVHYLREIQ